LYDTPVFKIETEGSLHNLIFSCGLSITCQLQSEMWKVR